MCLQQLLDERRLACADLAGDQRDRRARQDAVFQHGESAAMLGGPEQEIGVGHEREGPPRQPEMPGIDVERRDALGLGAIAGRPRNRRGMVMNPAALPKSRRGAYGHGLGGTRYGARRGPVPRSGGRAGGCSETASQGRLRCTGTRGKIEMNRWRIEPGIDRMFLSSQFPSGVRHPAVAWSAPHGVARFSLPDRHQYPVSCETASCNRGKKAQITRETGKRFRL